MDIFLKKTWKIGLHDAFRCSGTSSFGEVYIRPIFPIRNSSSFSCSMLTTLGNG